MCHIMDIFPTEKTLFVNKDKMRIERCELEMHENPSKLPDWLIESSQAPPQFSPTSCILGHALVPLFLLLPHILLLFTTQLLLLPQYFRLQTCQEKQNHQLNSLKSLGTHHSYANGRNRQLQRPPQTDPVPRPKQRAKFNLSKRCCPHGNWEIHHGTFPINALFFSIVFSSFCEPYTNTLKRIILVLFYF